MSRRIVLTAAFLALAFVGPAGATGSWNEGDGGRAAVAREVYRDNLIGCLSRLASCDRGRLSQEDRDYLAYEMRDQRFDRDTVRQVADVRMTIYGRGVIAVTGRSTGSRYPESGIQPARSGNGAAGGVIGLGRGVPDLKGLAEMGGELVRRIAVPGGE